MISIFKKNSATKDSLFVHIPKAGGSTFVGLLMDSIKIPKNDKAIPTHIIDNVGNVRISHIDFSTENRFFQTPEIFNKEREEDFKNQLLIFMLVRNPVDRTLSEFNFQYHMLKGKAGNKNAAIISKLKPLPNTIEDYIKFPHTHNYQVKFLLGRKIADPKPVSKKDFERVIDTIENLNIECGLTENYSQFLDLFQTKTGVKLKKKVIIRKRTPLELELFVDDVLKEKIKKLNNYDTMLYEYVKAKINNKIDSSQSKFSYNNSNDFIV